MNNSGKRHLHVLKKCQKSTMKCISSFVFINVYLSWSHTVTSRTLLKTFTTFSDGTRASFLLFCLCPNGRARENELSVRQVRRDFKRTKKDTQECADENILKCTDSAVLPVSCRKSRDTVRDKSLTKSSEISVMCRCVVMCLKIMDLLDSFSN